MAGSGRMYISVLVNVMRGRLDQQVYILALHRLLVNRPRRFRQVLERFKTAAAAFTGSGKDGIKMTRQLEQQVATDIDWLVAEGHHLVSIGDPDYPSCLKETYDPPCLLFAAGAREALMNEQRVAIVGSRKASSYGLNMAQKIAGDLTTAGVTVVSGLALGIDAAAHEGVLAARGSTLAVLGSGCDVVYPKRHWRLAERLQETGLLLSEFPLGTPARAAHFPRRNRIVTGLCRATLVVEAARESGSLVSARLAASEGRDVMAVPGLATNPQARGCHQLIRDGALLIEKSTDVLRELGLSAEASLDNLPGEPALEPSQRKLLACFDRGPMSIDTLAENIDFSIEELTVALVSLEVMGYIHSEGGLYLRTSV